MELVTGDAPQPGETPHEESNPWTFSDPDTAFWRGERDRETEGAVAAEAETAIPRRPRRGPAAAAQSATLTPPTFLGEEQHTGAEAEAHAAGRADAAGQLVRGIRAPGGVEHTHDKIDSRRFNPLSAYARPTPPGSESVPPRNALQLPAGPHKAANRGAIEPGRPRERPTESLDRPLERPRRRDPIEMPARQDPRPLELPAGEGKPRRELERAGDHPTVDLDHGPVPGQPPSGLSRLSRAAQRPHSPLLETSPFWLTEEQRAEHAARFPEQETREKPARAARRPRTPHRPATGLLGLIALALVATFFSWVSAEPFWLAVGHGRPGVVTVTQCTGNGMTQRCTGGFQATDGSYARARVTLLGVSAGQRNPGAVAPARMVDRDSRQAYVGETGPLMQLRWVLGFVLVLFCGLGIAGLTGSRQLESVRARRGALTMSLAGPLLLLLGFLAVTY